MGIGNNIRTLRKQSGWTQTELGEKVGVSQKIVADYETGATNPPVDRLPVIAKALGITVDQLLGIEELAGKEPEKRIHKNSRLAKIEKVFELLKPEDQRALLKQAKGIARKT